MRAALPGAQPDRCCIRRPAPRFNELRCQLAARGAQLFLFGRAARRQAGRRPGRGAGDSDVLLALPDSDIYNSNNIRQYPVQYSYHRGVPLVGLSQALVNAAA